MNLQELDLAWQLIPIELWNTIYMVLASTFFAIVLGLPLGVILFATDRGNFWAHPTFHKLLGGIVNIIRSFPFAILIVAIIPFTRFIVGTSLGTTATIVPLSIAAAPFFARLVENSLRNVDLEMIQAATVMGSTSWQILTKVLLPEALPSLFGATSLTMINLIGYSAMAGMVGGGGLGKVAIQYGYNRFDLFIMSLTVLLMILLVQGTQWLGSHLTKKILQKRGKTSHA